MKVRYVHKQGKLIEKRNRNHKINPQTRRSSYVLRQRADGMYSTENQVQNAGSSY